MDILGELDEYHSHIFLKFLENLPGSQERPPGSSENSPRTPWGTESARGRRAAAARPPRGSFSKVFEIPPGR